MTYTPESIESLNENEIFVYGSNQYAQHLSGAAAVANRKFGAIHADCPIGLVGQSYGIVTASLGDRPVPIEFIRSQVSVLYEFAWLRQDLLFYVTKIGCGIAGFKVREIASIFYSVHHIKPGNIILPKEFHP